MKASICSRSCRGEVKLVPTRALRDRIENQISTWLSQDACGGGVMKAHVLVPRQPTVVLGFVRVQIVEDDMDVAVGVVGDNAVHEVKKFDAPTTAVVARPDHPGGGIESGKQRRRTVPLVGMAEPGDCLAIGQLEPALGTLQLY